MRSSKQSPSARRKSLWFQLCIKRICKFSSMMSVNTICHIRIGSLMM